jgi:hypothetical protein
VCEIFLQILPVDRVYPDRGTDRFEGDSSGA